MGFPGKSAGVDCHFFSRGSSRPRNQTWVSCIAGTCFIIWDTTKVLLKIFNPAFSNMWSVNSQLFKLVLEKAEEPDFKLPISAGWSKKQESSRKTSFSASLTMPKPLTVWVIINCGKFWKRLRNLYAGQKARVSTGHGTTDWFQIGKGVRQGCILSPCLFNFYAESIMRNAGLEEAQAGIKIAWEKYQ